MSTQEELNRTANEVIRKVYDAINEALKVQLEGGDIQIGAVEIKDGSSENRAAVSGAGEQSVIDTNSAAIKTAVESINTKTPASPATSGKQDSEIALLVTLNQNTDGLEGSTGATATVLGTVNDSAITTDAVGTASAKLRGLVAILADVWDSVNNWFRTEEQMAAVAEDNDAGVIKVEERYTTAVIEANATTTHVTGAGFLRGFVVTDVGATGNVLDIYDNTAGSGTKMVSQVDTVACQTGYYPVNRSFTTGLTTVLATGTAAKLYLIFENRSA